MVYVGGEEGNRRGLIRISIVKTNQMHNISNFFYFGTTLYMFRTVSPPIIRSRRLYIQHQVCVVQVLWLASLTYMEEWLQFADSRMSQKKSRNTFKGGRTRSGRKSTVPCVEVKEHIDQHIPYTRGIKWWNWIWNEHESGKEVIQEWPKTTENLLFCLNQDTLTAGVKRLYCRSDRNTYR
jgi:hypothetical protein